MANLKASYESCIGMPQIRNRSIEIFTAGIESCAGAGTNDVSSYHTLTNKPYQFWDTHIEVGMFNKVCIRKKKLYL